MEDDSREAESTTEILRPGRGVYLLTEVNNAVSKYQDGDEEEKKDEAEESAQNSHREEEIEQKEEEEAVSNVVESSTDFEKVTEDEPEMVVKDDYVFEPEKQKTQSLLALTLNDELITSLPPLETTPEQDARCAEVLKDYKEYGILPSIVDREMVIKYIQRQKVNYIVELKYMEASAITKLAKQLSLDIAKAERKETLQMRIHAIEDKLNETNERIREVEQETQDLINQEMQNIKGKKDLLAAQHKKELELFEDEWNNEEYLKKFAKPSSNLMHLRTIEHSLVLMKDFETAEEYRLKIEKAESDESDNAQKRAEGTMRLHHSRLMSKQSSEIEALEDYANKSLLTINKAQQQKLQALLTRKQSLETELNTVKNSKPTTLPNLAVRTPSVSSSFDSAMTPRTAFRYNYYKTTKRPPKLTVKPMGQIVPTLKKKKLQKTL